MNTGTAKFFTDPNEEENAYNDLIKETSSPNYLTGHAYKIDTNSQYRKVICFFFINIIIISMILYLI